MKDDIVKKIINIVAKKKNLEEVDVRSLMILIRKLLDILPAPDQQLFLIIRLFSNWVAHNEINSSNTGLRILSVVNDTLVNIASSTDMDVVRYKMSQAIGLSALRKEMKLLFSRIGVDDILVRDDNVWAIFVNRLMEIIRGVPISFPKLSGLDATKQKIYEKIAHNSIKSGAGVISMQIADVRCNEPGNNPWSNGVLCLLLTLENKSLIAIPLLIDVRKYG